YSRGIAMTIKIAVFGRSELINRMQNIINISDAFEILAFKYSKIREVTHLLNHAFTCDVYVFLEPFAYLSVKSELDKKRVPSLYISVDEYMILTSFYQLRFSNKQKLNRLSIDVSNETHLNEVLNELHIHENEIYTYSYNTLNKEPPSIQDLFNFHQELWEKGKIDMVLTSIKDMEQKLQTIGIPVRSMHIPQSNITEVIEQANSIILLHKNKSAQIVTVNIDMNHIHKHSYQRHSIVYYHYVIAACSHESHAANLSEQEHHDVLYGSRCSLHNIICHAPLLPVPELSHQMTSLDVD